jgi:oxygen-dependent protoporphyrinogen oxidase
MGEGRGEGAGNPRYQFTNTDLADDVNQAQSDANSMHPHPNPLPEGEGTSESTQNGETFDSIILATPSNITAKLLADVDPILAAELGGIEHASSAIVVLGYNRSQIADRMESFGFVVPAIEQRKILSASYSSVKFPGRAPEGKALIRVFIGGALQAEILEHSDDQLRAIAEEELSDLLGIRGGAEISQVFRWPGAMPQYYVGHLDRLQRIERRLAQLPGLALAGNVFTGVGIPQCIRSGEAAAENLMTTTV